MTGIVQTLIGGFGAVAAAVTDAYFNLVTLLLPGNGTNGAQNNTFLDSSSNNFTITRNGNTTQGTFSPFSQTGWSGYFDGASDYIQYTNSDFSVSTGDFTAEWWMFITSDKSQVGIMTASTNSNLTIGYGSGTANARQPYVEWGGTGAYIGTMSNYMNTWVHICVMRSSGTVYTFQNGTLLSSASKSAAVGSTANMVIGTNAGDVAGQGVPGYLSNVRFAKAAIYSTSGFTAPTSPLTRTSQSATNVQFLTLQSNRFLDSDGVNTPASSPLAITRNGDTSIQAFSPFAPTAAYSASTNGGSGYFDGSGDYLTVADNDALDLTGDFTIECWVYPTNVSPGYNSNMISRWAASGGTIYNMQIQNGGTFRFVTSANAYTGGSITPNTWTHVAATRSGTSLRLFRNGVLESTNTDSTSFSGTQVTSIGAEGDGASAFPGYICGARIVKGTAVYTAAFTPPTAPPTNITNTSLLANFTNAGITDATAKNDLETVGNAQISTTQSKFGGSSMYFDGTGDYLSIPYSSIYTIYDGDFTVEGWIYPATVTGSELPVFKLYGATNAVIELRQVNNTMSMTYRGTNGTSSTLTSSAGTIAINTWQHVAFVRSSGTLRAFIDGTQYTTASNTSSQTETGLTIRVGSNQAGTATFNGYIDDFRFSRFARYTASFTPPTAPFPTQ